MNHDEDLTASHWDDVISPHTQSQYGSNSLDQTFNGFQNLGINEEDDDKKTESEGDETDQHPQIEQDPNTTDPQPADEYYQQSYTASSYDRTYDGTYDGSYGTARESYGQSYDAARSELDQLHEMKKEERNETRTKLMEELASAEDFDSLEKATSSPARINSTDELFKDTNSPLKFKDLSAIAKTGTSKTNGGKKFKRPRKFTPGKNSKHLGADLGPLAQLKADDTSKTTAKEDLVRETEGPLYDIPGQSGTEPRTGQEKDLKQAPGLPKADGPSNAGKSTQSRPFDITVSDPMKVGDITNAHIVYTITTKVKGEVSGVTSGSTFSVTRRYKDFRWIYHQLQNNHLGRIVPPPPSKQRYLGRFNESFIENRRLSLEKMLNKISELPLSQDADFFMFLSSNDFANESKERERISGSKASLQNNDSLDDSINAVTDTSSNQSGFMSSISIFNIPAKIDEPDAFFSEKKQYIETLETNLKNFYHAIDVIINQRMEIITVIEQITIALGELSDLEISKTTTNLLYGFRDIQIKLKDSLDRINLQDHLTLGFTIEEYLRLIGSIKYTLDQRTKIYTTFQNFEADLNKKKQSLNKYKLKNQVDKIGTATFEVEKLSTKTEGASHSFNQISKVIKEELQQFELDKIDDFRNSVEIYIESSIESQKESIELWETFYERVLKE